MTSHKYFEAIAYLEQAVKKDPENKQYAAMLAEARQKSVEQLITTLNKTLNDGKWGKLVAINDVSAMASAILDGCEGRLLPIPKEIIKKKYAIDYIGSKYLSY